MTSYTSTLFVWFFFLGKKKKVSGLLLSCNGADRHYGAIFKNCYDTYANRWVITRGIQSPVYFCMTKYTFFLPTEVTHAVGKKDTQARIPKFSEKNEPLSKFSLRWQLKHTAACHFLFLYLVGHYNGPQLQKEYGRFSHTSNAGCSRAVSRLFSPHLSRLMYPAPCLWSVFFPPFFVGRATFYLTWRTFA